jgi:hypothetical protein
MTEERASDQQKARVELLIDAVAFDLRRSEIGNSVSLYLLTFEVA